MSVDKAWYQVTMNSRVPIMTYVYAMTLENTPLTNFCQSNEERLTMMIGRLSLSAQRTIGLMTVYFFFALVMLFSNLLYKLSPNKA